jgi:hypothetical protein
MPKKICMRSGIEFDEVLAIRGGGKMKEGMSGLSRRPRGGSLPSDAKLWEELNSWEMYISKQDQSLIIETSEYHPGLLCLTREDLEEIIKALSK